jgi:hypothetical protein
MRVDEVTMCRLSSVMVKEVKIRKLGIPLPIPLHNNEVLELEAQNLAEMQLLLNESEGEDLPHGISSGCDAVGLQD